MLDGLELGLAVELLGDAEVHGRDVRDAALLKHRQRDDGRLGPDFTLFSRDGDLDMSLATFRGIFCLGRSRMTKERNNNDAAPCSAGGRSRTDTPLQGTGYREPGFESAAFTSSTTPALPSPIMAALDLRTYVSDDGVCF